MAKVIKKKTASKTASKAADKTQVRRKKLTRNFVPQKALTLACNDVRSNPKQFAGLTRPEIAEALTARYGARFTWCNVRYISELIGIPLGLEPKRGRPQLRGTRGSIGEQIAMLLETQRELQQMMTAVIGELRIDYRNGGKR